MNIKNLIPFPIPFIGKTPPKGWVEYKPAPPVVECEPSLSGYWCNKHKRTVAECSRERKNDDRRRNQGA